MMIFVNLIYSPFMFLFHKYFISQMDSLQYQNNLEYLLTTDLNIIYHLFNYLIIIIYLINYKEDAQIDSYDEIYV